MSSKEILKDFLLKYIDTLALSGSSGSIAILPDFDYYAMDYLQFAELNFEKYYLSTQNLQRENELIGCLSNLKRALDCQIECFLSSWNLRSDFQKKNLGIDKKLAFLSAIGIFSSRTINRFTQIRNKFEHDFHQPQINDLEALFDLVSAFITILQNATSNLISSNVEFEIWNEIEQEGILSMTFDMDKKNITVEIFIKNIQHTQKETIIADLKNYEEFSYFFRCLHLLNQLNSYGNINHIKSKIDF